MTKIFQLAHLQRFLGYFRRITKPLHWAMGGAIKLCPIQIPLSSNSRTGTIILLDRGFASVFHHADFLKCNCFAVWCIMLLLLSSALQTVANLSSVLSHSNPIKLLQMNLFNRGFPSISFSLCYLSSVPFKSH